MITEVVCKNCGSDGWCKDSSQSEGDSSCDVEKGKYEFEFKCPDCNKVNKATFVCVDVKLLNKKDL